MTVGSETEGFIVSYDSYESYQGDGQKSGAYIFRSEGNTAKKYSPTKSIHYAEGTRNVIIVLEGERTNSKLIFSKMEGYVDEKGFEIETFINSI